MADGEVTYEVRADYSNVDQDLDQAQKKVEKSSQKTAEKTEQIEKKTGEKKKQIKEKVTEHHKEQNTEQEKSDQDSGKKREETAKDSGERLKSIAGGTGKIIGAGMLAVGTAAIAIGGKAVESAVNMDQAMNQFISSTGKGKEETEKYQTVLEDIYKNNYGESFEDIGQAMSDVTKQLGDMSDAQLQDVTESAFALRDVFGYEIPESTRAAKAMMDNFGISGEDAMNLIAAGAQNGLDYSGELIDSINEYSSQFAKVGLDADDMFKIFQKGTETGAWNLDKIGDAVKEMSIRVIDGSKTTVEGFELIGLNADEMASKFAAGGDSAKDAFQQTVSAMAQLQDPLAQNTAGVNLFGTTWEDLGPEVVTQLADISEGVYDTTDAMNGIKEVKYDDLGSMFEGLKRSAEMLLLPLGEQLIPIIQDLLTAVMPVIEDVLPVLIQLFEELMPPIMDLVEAVLPVVIELFQKLLPPILDIINMVLPPLIELLNVLLPLFMSLIDILMPVIELFIELLEPIIKLITEAITPLLAAIQPLIEILAKNLVTTLTVLMTVFKSVFTEIVDNISDKIKTITNIFNNIIDFVKNVFTGNWKGAWENIKNIFKSIAEGIGNAFKAPINLIISLLNGFINGVNKIKIPDWVPGVGGKGLNIPNIPRLKVGMDFVPADYFPAYLDYGEAVLTADEAALYRASGSNLHNLLSKPHTAINSSGLGMSDMEVTIRGEIHTHVNLDSREVGEAVSPFVSHELAISTRRSR